MKKILRYLPLLLAAASLATACNDSDPVPGPYDAINGYYRSTSTTHTLDLTYSGSALPGKQVAFFTADGKTAELTFTDVVPGEPDLEFRNVALRGTGGSYTFGGTDSRGGRELRYTGSIEAGRLALSVEVTMPATPFLGTWDLAREGSGTDGPTFLVWESSVALDLFGSPVPISTMMPLLTQLTNKILPQVLQSVTFLADGNITATFSKAGIDLTGEVTPVWQQSPVNMAQYYVRDGAIYVILNPYLIVGAAAGGTPGTQASAVTTSPVPPTKAIDFGEIMARLQQIFSQGIPVHYTLEGGKAAIWIDQEPIMPFADLIPLIAGLIPEGGNEMISALLGPILEQMPDILRGTTEMKIGINLQRAQ